MIDGQSLKYLVKRSACCRNNPKHPIAPPTRKTVSARAYWGRNMERGKGRYSRRGTHMQGTKAQHSSSCPNFWYGNVFGREAFEHWALAASSFTVPRPRFHDVKSSYPVGKLGRSPSLPGVRLSHQRRETHTHTHTHTVLKFVLACKVALMSTTRRSGLFRRRSLRITSRKSVCRSRSCTYSSHRKF